jgi:uncharacterized protein
VIDSLGHGIGLRPAHYARLLSAGASGVEWFEAISENFFELGGRPFAVLERVRRDVPVVLHGVGMGIGSSEPPSPVYLSKLRRLMERIEPAWVSDHVCWGSADGHFSHDLLPVPYTEEMLELLTGRLLRVQDTLDCPLVLENITSYLRFAGDTIPEWEFLNELTARTGAKLLLDLNNVYVNSQNLGFDPRTFIRGVRVGSVQQFHLAGHTVQPDFILDSHVGPVPDAVWELYRLAVRCLGCLPSLVEWDERVPELEAVRLESLVARRISAEVAAAAVGLGS